MNKSEGEPAIVALKNQAVADVEPKIEAIAQEIPADDHAANGEIEVAVREIKKQVRVGKLALESKLKKKLREDDPVIAWLPRHSADLINRYRIGED